MSPITARRAQIPLDQRLRALATAVRLGEGRLDPAALEDTRGVLDRAGERLRLSGEHTVVAIAGATGSGKSSLFNAIAGLELSQVGVRRPTTATALACVWGPEGAGSLLDWLGIPRRHQIQRESVLDGDTQADLHGLVLLDLPDHDSTVAEHRLEVDRLVRMVDLFVWVMDPQKYADAAVHEQYLRPLASHAGVTVVLLNQVDKLSAGDAKRCRADLERLLADDGLGEVDVVMTSATTGAGLGDLRDKLVEQVRAKRAAGERLSADVGRAAARFEDACGDGKAAEVGKRERTRLLEALGQAAGVPVVSEAVERSHRYRAVAVTGWPLTRWIRRFRPDPLRRLHLDRAARTSLPAPTPVMRSQVQSAVRAIADAASTGLPPEWVGAVRRASRSREQELPDALDQAVARADLGVAREPLWWRLAGLLQFLFLGAAVAGTLWLIALLAFDYLQLPDPPTPDVGLVPWPTLLLFGGLAGGLLLAALSRIPAAVGGKRRRRRAEAHLHAAVDEVAEEYVLLPVDAEVTRYGEVCAAVSIAKG
jgi:GTP-binding protein EngB required for normal cell division